MITNYSKHSRREKRIKARMDVIKTKYPDFDFHNPELRSDLQKYWSLMKDYVYASVNAKSCKSDNPNLMCEDCICWKQVRKNAM